MASPSTDPTAILARAAAHLAAGEAPQAEALFRARLAAVPRDWVAASNLGVALDAQGKFADAAAAHGVALAANPSHLPARFNLAAALLKLGDRAAALPHLNAILADPAAPAALRSQTFAARLAATAQVVGRMDDDHPASPEVAALFAEAIDFRSRGLRDASLDRLRRVLAAQPDHGLAAILAGQECYWAGLLDEAHAHYAVALRWKTPNWQRANPEPAKRFDIGAARVALFDLLDALEGAGATPFLIGGTALGCVRDGDFISFDSDIDVGVPVGTAPEPLIDALDLHPGLRLVSHDVFRDKVIRLRFAASNGVGGDIFLYQQDQDGHWCGIQRGPFAMRWRDTKFALAPRNFLGRSVLLPDPAERFLVENYGAWQTPDPDHIPGFSSPNLIDPAGPLAHATIYGSILAAMERGDAGQVRRYCREAAARFPDDALLAATLAAVQ